MQMTCLFLNIVLSSLYLCTRGYLKAPLISKHRPVCGPIRATSDAAQRAVQNQPSAESHSDDKYMEQKNFILLEKFISPITGNLTETANEYVNFCDDSFNDFLNDRISQCESKSGKVALGRIRYELNVARHNKLIHADRILRGILKAGGVLEMETKLRSHLRGAEIDMAFMVILQLNIEDAARANAHKAVEVMTRLGAIISEYQDTLVSAPVRLMRLLVRTEDPTVRKQMLRRKLILAPPVRNLADSYQNGFAQSSQPNHASIGDSVLHAWGNADVTVPELEDTIRDVLMQIGGLGGGLSTPQDLDRKCSLLREEMKEVIAEARDSHMYGGLT